MKNCQRSSEQIEIFCKTLCVGQAKNQRQCNPVASQIKHSALFLGKFHALTKQIDPEYKFPETNILSESLFQQCKPVHFADKLAQENWANKTELNLVGQLVPQPDASRAPWTRWCQRWRTQRRKTWRSYPPTPPTRLYNDRNICKSLEEAENRRMCIKIKDIWRRKVAKFHSFVTCTPCSLIPVGICKWIFVQDLKLEYFSLLLQKSPESDCLTSNVHLQDQMVQRLHVQVIVKRLAFCMFQNSPHLSHAKISSQSCKGVSFFFFRGFNCNFSPSFIQIFQFTSAQHKKNVCNKSSFFFFFCDSVGEKWQLTQESKETSAIELYMYIHVLKDKNRFNFSLWTLQSWWCETFLIRNLHVLSPFIFS